MYTVRLFGIAIAIEKGLYCFCKILLLATDGISVFPKTLLNGPVVQSLQSFIKFRRNSSDADGMDQMCKLMYQDAFTVVTIAIQTEHILFTATGTECIFGGTSEATRTSVPVGNMFRRIANMSIFRKVTHLLLLTDNHHLASLHTHCMPYIGPFREH